MLWIILLKNKEKIDSVDETTFIAISGHGAAGKLHLPKNYVKN